MLLTIIRKELLLTTRDIHALLVLFLMPTAFILIMSLSLQDTFQKSESEKPLLGVFFSGQTDEKSPLNKILDSVDGFQVTQFKNESDLLESTKQDKHKAAIVIPQGFYNRVKSKKPISDDHRLQIYFAPTTPHAMRALIESAIQKLLISEQLNKLLDEIGFDPKENRIQKQKLNGIGLVSTHELYTNSTHKKPSSVQQSVPAWLIFSMFFVVIPITTTFLNEKQNGTMQRLKTLPIPTSYFLTGKLAPYLGINLIQTGLMFLVGVYLTPALGGQALELNDQAWLLIPMSIAVSITAITLALLIATLVKTIEQATTIGGLINLLLGATGGIMVPTFIMPLAMQNIASYSPMNWGLEGFLTILLRGGSFLDILPEITKLALLSVVFFSLAIFFYHRGTRIY